MSGTIAAATLVLADIASVTIDGINVEVAGSLTYNHSGESYEQNVNTNGFDGTFKRTFVLGSISASFRMSANFPESQYNAIKNSQVVVIRNDGKKLIASGCYIETPCKPNPAEYTVDVELKSNSVVDA